MLFEDTVEVGEGLEADGIAGAVALHIAEGDPQRAVGIGIDLLALSRGKGDSGGHPFRAIAGLPTLPILGLALDLQQGRRQGLDQHQSRIVGGLDGLALGLEPLHPFLAAGQPGLRIEGIEPGGQQLGRGLGGITGHPAIHGGDALRGRQGDELAQHIFHQRAVDLRIETPVHLLQAALQTGLIARLVAGFALGIGLLAFNRQAIEIARRGVHPRIAQQLQQQIAVAGGAGLGQQLLQTLEAVDAGRLIVRLRPFQDLPLLGGLGGNGIDPGKAVQIALEVLQPVVQTGDRAGVLDGGIRTPLGVLIDQRQQPTVAFDQLRVLPADGINHLGRQSIAVGAAGIAGNHREIARLEAGRLQFQMRFRAIGHVGLTVIGRLAVGPDVGAVEGKVSRVTGPDPVVDIATKLADGRRRRIHQAHITDFHLLDQKILGAAVEDIHVAAIATGRLAFGHQRLFLRIDGRVALIAALFGIQGGHHLIADFGDRLGHVDPQRGFTGQLFAQGAGEEAVAQQIAIGRGIELDAAVGAVVVGDYQTHRRDERCRAEAETDHRIHRIAGQVGQFLGIDLDSRALQISLNGRQLMRLPHALDSEGMGGDTHQQGKAQGQSGHGRDDLVWGRHGARDCTASAGAAQRPKVPAKEGT